MDRYKWQHLAIAKSRSRRTVEFAVKLVSLEELCFTHIVMTLEEYTDEELALLPKPFREQLMHSIPVVDVCRLEGTQFTSDIDTSSFWEQIYKEYFVSFGEVSTDWKVNLFTDLAHSVIGNNYSQFDRYTCLDPNYQVACLLAIKNEIQRRGVKTVLIHAYQGMTRTVLIHETQERIYHSKSKQTPKQNVLIPARHEKYFSENDKIPNSTALEIIINKCLFHPKEITISINTFYQFLNTLASQKSSDDILTTFFKELEKLTIWNEQWLSTADIIAASTLIKETTSKLLRLVLSCNKQKLVTLRVKVSRMIPYGNKGKLPVDDTEEVTSLQFDNPTIDSIAPVLSSSYNGLKTFALDATGCVSLPLEKLISITEHQSELDTISIKIARRSQPISADVNTPLIWQTPQFSAKFLPSWIHCCLQKPTLRHFTLCLSPVSTEFFINILVTFLSTSSTHEQTITLDQMDYLSDTSCKSTSSLKLNEDMQKSSSSNDKSEAALHHFDELCTQCKSIEFNACDLKLFTEPLFALKFLKLKQMIIRKLTEAEQSKNIYKDLMVEPKKDCSFFVSQLAQYPDFTMETLEIAEVDLSSVTSSDYDALLRKKTLQTVRLVQCTGINITAVREVAARQKLNIEVACESSTSHTIKPFPDRPGFMENTKTKKDLITITLTK